MFYKCIAAVNICIVNVAKDTKMSYVFWKVFEHFLLFGFSSIWTGVSHFLCWELTCRIVRGAGQEKVEGVKFPNNLMKQYH